MRDQAERQAFEAYYNRREGEMRRYATAILGADAADDACQDAWLRIWRAWGSADGERLDAWSLRIVRNCCLDRRRSERRDRSEIVAAPHVASPEDQALSRIRAGNALPLLKRLPLPMREALWLREAMEMTYAEIAQIQGVPIGTVMSRLHKARRQAAKLLRKDDR